ncbi:hypothetical protein [Parasitella parasitica]|uniref:Uncharacterized protein n=1 Tax=Parasitella parasitica TaxID=35722 RepID=A0A0B7NUB7_9FUNG|nr:hypothetical protein [Parasitella parasitica]
MSPTEKTMLQTLILQPFFRSLCVPTESPGPPTDLQVSVSFSPFAQQLKVFQDIGMVSHIPTKIFREACVSSSVVPTYLSTITKTLGCCSGVYP